MDNSQFTFELIPATKNCFIDSWDLQMVTRRLDGHENAQTFDCFMSRDGNIIAPTAKLRRWLHLTADYIFSSRFSASSSSLSGKQTSAGATFSSLLSRDYCSIAEFPACKLTNDREENWVWTKSKCSIKLHQTIGDKVVNVCRLRLAHLVEVIGCFSFLRRVKDQSSSLLLSDCV